MRYWKLALSVALGFSVLWLLSPSRSIQTSADGVEEITYMGPQGALSGPMDDAVKAFEKESEEAHAKDPSQPVYRVISGQNASRDQTADPTRFLVSVAGGMPPDVIYFDRYAVSQWASKSVFEKLDPFLEGDLQAKAPDAIHPEDYLASAWDEAVYTDPVSGDKGLYGIPNGIDNRALFYNQDLLKQAGFVDAQGNAQPPRTWEELERMALALTRKGPDGHLERLGYIPNFGNAWLCFYGWMNGGEFMSPDFRRVTLTDPKVEQALGYVTRLYDELGGATEVSAFQSGFHYSGETDPLLIGKLAMVLNGYWMISNYAQFGRYLHWAAAPPPMPEAELAKGRPPVSWVGGWVYAIPTTAKHKEAAWKFIRFMRSWRAMRLMAESSALQAASQGHPFVPGQDPHIRFNQWQVEKYVLNAPGTDPKVKQAVTLFNQYLPGARFRPVTPVGQLLFTQEQTALDNAIFHKLTPEGSLKRAQGIVQKQLDLLLRPPEGRVVPWRWVLYLYGVLLALLAAGAFYWDTRPSWREKAARLLKPFGGQALASSGERVEGISGGYFRGQWKDGWLCAFPWIFGFVVFTGGPIVFSILISFTRYDILNPARFVGLENYRWMLTQDDLFWKSLWNTTYMVLGIPLGMALSLGIALLLNQKIRGMALWRTFFYLPSIIPAVASSILWVWILNPNNGLLNTVLASAGLHGPNWLQDENTSKFSLILMGLWGAGGGMIIWLAGLKGIDKSFYEAAALDGATPFQQFLHVTLPMLSPYILFNLIMGMIGTFQIFTEAYIMTQGGPLDSTLFYVYHLFNNAFRYLQMGYAAAMAWFLFLIVFGLTLVQLRLSKRWVHYAGD